MSNTARRAPVQGVRRIKPPGTIAWAEHELAYAAHAAQYGYRQTAERLAERGGFCWLELIELLGREPETWKPRDEKRYP